MTCSVYVVAGFCATCPRSYYNKPLRIYRRGCSERRAHTVDRISAASTCFRLDELHCSRYDRPVFMIQCINHKDCVVGSAARERAGNARQSPPARAGAQTALATCCPGS